MKTANLSSVFFIVAALVMSATSARAENVSCTPITALPAVITAQGIYCLTADLATAMTSGVAIDIQKNNVVLDLNGHKLVGKAAGPGTNTIGIHAINHQNITVRNGTVRGFLEGIRLESTGSSSGHVVEDIRADQNTLTGIEVVGAASIIRNNQVVATGGSTAFGPNVSSFGIFVRGSGPRVLNNDVIDTFGQGTGEALGIELHQTLGGLVVNNRVTTADKGIAFTAGGTGKYRDNLTFDVTTPFIGGTDSGNND